MKRFAFAALFFVACSSPPVDQTPVVTCAKDERVKSYSAGMTASASEVVVTLLDADPSPPARGDNVWKVRATDSSGAVLTGATLSVTAFMPDHGHGTSVTPQVESTGDGEWTVSQLSLFMPGVWRVTFTVKNAGKTTDTTFFFCIAG